MAKASGQPATDTLALGWAELEAGRWKAAMESFQRATVAAETPEALEGLSWAAWWLDDADTVFDARRRAYGLYKRNGDAIGAARMATWLACDELDFHGAVAVASGWLARAHRLLDPLEPGPEHGWLAFFEGYIASASGDSARTLELAARAAELGRQLDVPDLEMLGLGLEGAVLVADARVDDGMRRLDEATAAALEDEAGIPIAGAWTCCFLVSACTAVRDYGRALEWCDRIAEFAERYGSRYMLAFCRAEYGVVHLSRGRWGEAQAVLEASIEDFDRSRPAMAEPPLAGLAELKRRQGRTKEAERLLERAGPVRAAQVCRAQMALDRGDALRAVELVERTLRQMPDRSSLARAPALELLVRGRAVRGELEEASAALEQLREIGRAVGTEPLRAGVDLAEGIVLAAAGDHERARKLFEDSIDGFDRSGTPFESSQARLELSVSLVALGRSDAARKEATHASEKLLELGAGVEARRARTILGTAAPAEETAVSALTAREREVLALLAEGLTNRQIAERLVVSEHTVHRHVTNILRKLELPSRTAAAAHAVRHGLGVSAAE